MPASPPVTHLLYLHGFRSSPLSTKARKVDVRFDEKVRYELDGGARSKTKNLKVRIRPHALVVCVPQPPIEVAPVDR